MWGARFGRGFGPVVRQTTKWNEMKWIIIIIIIIIIHWHTVLTVYPVPPSERQPIQTSLFLHLLTLINFRSFSVQCSHLSFGLPALLLPSGFPRNTSLTFVLSDILTTWPAHSSLLALFVVTIFGFLYLTCQSPVRMKATTQVNKTRSCNYS